MRGLARRGNLPDEIPWANQAEVRLAAKIAEVEESEHPIFD